MFKYDELHSKVCLDKENPGYTNVGNILGSRYRGDAMYMHIPFDEIEWGPNVRIAPELAPYFHLSRRFVAGSSRTALRLIWLFDPNIINLYSLDRYVGKIERLLMKNRPHPFEDVKTVGSCFYAVKPYADAWIECFSSSSNFEAAYVFTGVCKPGFFHLERSMKKNYKWLAF